MVAFVIIAVGVIAIISLCAFARIINAAISNSTGAQKKGKELLRTVLSPEEYHQLTVRGHVDIASPGHPQRVYRVPGFPGHVQLREPGRPPICLCLQPAEWLPAADHVVIHKLMIEADEETYLRTANRLPSMYCGVEH